MKYKEKYNDWLSFADDETKSELLAAAGNEKDVEDRFYKDLAFGTGGLRGVMGAGSNRMNKYTVGRATLGLAAYIKNKFEADCSVAVAYDTRNNSSAFADTVAKVLAAKGIKVYKYSYCVPVPVLSFTTRLLGCSAGVMITASHNPKEYNGYKAFDETGCQICKSYSEAAEILEGKTVNADLINEIGDNELDAFYDAVSKQSLYEEKSDLKIVYTPLHGTGNIPVRKMLANFDVTVVKEQELPDGNFSTVRSPNPEEKDALNLAIEKAKEIGADIVLGTDPDCDRVGIAVRDENGDYILFTGNQTGALLVKFVLDMKKSALNKKSTLVKTIVTSELGADIARNYGLNIDETLTGFKYIGDKINQYEKSGEREFVIGYEESYGYLVGTHARDKDAVVASMLCAEMVCYYDYKGKTVSERLEEIYKDYGYVLDKNISIQYKGLNAMKEMNAVVDGLKTKPVTKFDIYKVAYIRDYSKNIKTEVATGKTSPIGSPTTNCVYYELENGSFICVRPSGTEPKLKIYYSVKSNTKADAEEALSKMQAAVEKLLKSI